MYWGERITLCIKKKGNILVEESLRSQVSEWCSVLLIFVNVKDTRQCASVEPLKIIRKTSLSCPFNPGVT